MAGDREQVKDSLIYNFSHGRTTSLRGMKDSEYNAMCDAMEAQLKHPGITDSEYKQELKRLRSAVLHRMQKMGIDTADWNAVDRFCLQPRIAGKRFARLDPAELEVLIAKLEAIRRKKQTTLCRNAMSMPIFVNPYQIPS